MQFKWHQRPRAELYGDVRSSKSAEGSESRWDLSNTHVWSRSTGSPEQFPSPAPPAGAGDLHGPGCPVGRQRAQDVEIRDLGIQALWKPHPDLPPTWEPTSWGGKLTSEGPYSSLWGLCLFHNNCFSGQALVPGTFPPCFTQTELKEDKGSGSQHPGYYCGLLTKQWHFSSTQKEELFLNIDPYIIFERQGQYAQPPGKFPNFYLHLLPLFVNIQSPDYSLILPTFLATSLFLATFSPCNTFTCPSPSLALFPPFLLFVILIGIFFCIICFWFRG